MALWRPADRVQHATLGTGTVIECKDQHTVIHFDDHGRRKFASHPHMVLLIPTTSPQAAAGRRRPVMPTQPTAPAASKARTPLTDVPSSIDQLVDRVRRKVGSEDSLNQFVSSMRRALVGPRHQHVGVLSGMRVQQLQNWLLDENPKWQLTDAQLLAVMRVEFPNGDRTGPLR